MSSMVFNCASNRKSTDLILIWYSPYPLKENSADLNLVLMSSSRLICLKGLKRLTLTQFVSKFVCPETERENLKIFCFYCPSSVIDFYHSRLKSFLSIRWKKRCFKALNFFLLYYKKGPAKTCSWVCKKSYSWPSSESNLWLVYLRCCGYPPDNFCWLNSTHSF